MKDEKSRDWEVGKPAKHTPHPSRPCAAPSSLGEGWGFRKQRAVGKERGGQGAIADSRFKIQEASADYADGTDERAGISGPKLGTRKV